MSANAPTRLDTEARQERIGNLYERSLAADQAQLDPDRHLIGQPAVDQPEVRTYRQASLFALGTRAFGAG